MVLDALDELAATVAAGLDDGRRSRAEIAARAYDIAEALLQERHAREGGGHRALVEALPHHPSWEVEPRWSLADVRAAAAKHAARSRAAVGPGLARVQPCEIELEEEAVG